MARQLDSLRESTRLLEDEIKLASRPQIYLLLDLSAPLLLIKGRGLELHRIPVTAWRASDEGPLKGVFRLRARPQTERPKAKPGSDPLADPIDLGDMPGEYALLFDPPLTVAVAPPARERPWLWAKSHLREWWSRVTSWFRFSAEAGQPGGPRLRLTLSMEAAQSLAWSLTDGMPLLIGKMAQPQEDSEK